MSSAVMVRRFERRRIIPGDGLKELLRLALYSNRRKSRVEWWPASRARGRVWFLVGLVFMGAMAGGVSWNYYRSLTRRWLQMASWPAGIAPDRGIYRWVGYHRVALSKPS